METEKNRTEKILEERKWAREQILRLRNEDFKKKFSDWILHNIPTHPWSECRAENDYELVLPIRDIKQKIIDNAKDMCKINNIEYEMLDDVIIFTDNEVFGDYVKYENGKPPRYVDKMRPPVQPASMQLIKSKSTINDYIIIKNKLHDITEMLNDICRTLSMHEDILQHIDMSTKTGADELSVISDEIRKTDCNLI